MDEHEHEHEWRIIRKENEGLNVYCKEFDSCGEALWWNEVEEILNNPTVKPAIDEVMADRI